MASKAVEKAECARHHSFGGTEDRTASPHLIFRIGSLWETSSTIG